MRKLILIGFIVFLGCEPIYISAQNVTNVDTIKRARTSLYMELGGSGILASIGVNVNLLEKDKLKFYNSFLLSNHTILVPYLNADLGINYGVGVRYGNKIFIGFQTNLQGYFNFYDNFEKKLYYTDKAVDFGGSFTHQFPIGFYIKKRIEFNISLTLIYSFYEHKYYPWLGFGVGILFNKKMKYEKK